MKIQKVKEWKESKRAQFKVAELEGITEIALKNNKFVELSGKKIISVVRLKDNRFFSLKNHEEQFYFSKLDNSYLEESVYVVLRIGAFFKDLINVSLYYDVLDVTGVNILGDTHFLLDVCPINEIEKHKKAFKDFDFISFLKRESSKINKNYQFMQSH